MVEALLFRVRADIIPPSTASTWYTEFPKPTSCPRRNRHLSEPCPR